MLDSMKSKQAIHWTAYGLCLALSGVGACRSELDEARGSAGRLPIDDGGGGEAAPVVFVHSFAGDASHWRAQLAHLRPRRPRCVQDIPDRLRPVLSNESRLSFWRKHNAGSYDLSRN